MGYTEDEAARMFRMYAKNLGYSVKVRGKAEYRKRRRIGGLIQAVVMIRPADGGITFKHQNS